MWLNNKSIFRLYPMLCHRMILCIQDKHTGPESHCPPLPPPIVLQPMYQIASLLYASGKTQYTQVHVVTRAFFRGRVGGASTCIRDSSTCAASRESEPQVKRDSSYPHLSGAYGPFEGAVEGEHEDAEPQPHQPTRDTPVTLARL